MKIKIKYKADIQKIEKIANGDWIDLRAARDMFITEGTADMIPLGVAIELPKGYEAIVLPRSSTFKNFGVIMTNSAGVIDNSYCGDDDQWHFPAYCLKGTEIKDGRRGTMIPKDARIAQFRILENQPELEIEEAESLGNKNRGGFGSTGI